MEDHKRVVITGIGVISPFGVGVEKLWESLKEGKTAIGKVTFFDPSGMSCQVAAEVKDFDPSQFINSKYMVSKLFC